ncbi:2-succinyl-6-hydroxy-2,4-cyclohexadiene-1-carboxylate synthase [Planococcus sp. PAMC 21323]|uniref:2-succinyl-6-hydroxy-2, 4-cyclohexadiene-1-carboxylate synthase n=1 Tax=Planococcus sp. PAMC 21323 TaxID=1526927 RepID=UPI000571276F|nr:2-succinyl-6-hydroxy-2,4-cyclohexadiene-1-carboxylate synthase [Planococcus sp. PAMC 21323]AIY04956.1 2-succinyl-6-hydroxy-2,4-cyclohexadiene-1-carboxylate synthase [Planococcus sp. PAMC 21323]
MKLEVGGVVYYVEVRNPEKLKTLVFLHGFTGSTKTWHSVIENWTDVKVVLIDLIGHGESASPEELEAYSMERQLESLDALFNRLALDNFTLVGYSMGGRTALAYACHYPERLTELVLESASPGLESEQARKERQINDKHLAERIVTGGLINFVNAWENIALFASQKTLTEAVQKSVREERLAQNPLGLANSLLGMGTGAQQSYWQELECLNIPVLLVTGRLDLKFEAIAQKMMECLSNGVHKTIDAGHAIHVEKPVEFATIVREYLSLNYQGGKS